MKITTFKTVSFAFLSVILLTHSSCNNSNSDSDDSASIDSSYLLQTNDTIKNKQTLLEIKQRITALRFDETFVQAESSVLRMKFSGKSPALRVAAFRYRSA